MPYDDLTDRTESQALIPEEVTREIIQNVAQGSVIMQLATRLPNMSRKQQRLPILSALPSAYFVNGDTGLKQTTQMAWGNKFINAEELAVIVPIPEAVLDDADYDIWGEVRPRLEEAFMAKFDRSVIHGGGDTPGTWPTALVPGAAAASHAIDLSTAVGAGSDLYDVLLGEGSVFSKVEEDGFMVNGSVAGLTMKAKLRGLRDADKQPVFMRSLSNGQNMQSAARYELDGTPIFFPQNGAVDTATALLIAGDWKQLVFSIRQDITFKILDQAVITDNTGAIIHNLAQQDMVALRAVMRLGWELPNPVNLVNSNNVTRYPFATLVP